jgi:imidazolonepropionase-like amidohydrolase
MGAAGLLRSALAAAADYERKRKSAPADKTPDRHLGHEALAEVLAGKTVAVFAGQRADDLNTALRVAGEFKLQPVLALAAEGYLTADALAASKAPVIVHPTMQTPGGVENLHTYLGNAAALADRGILAAIASGMESYVPKTRVARYEAAVAMNYGLGWQRALRAITLDAAQILRVADRFGSLDVGKEGDLVLYDGDPFEYATHVERVIVGGALAYDRTEELAVPFNRLVFLGGGPDPACCLGF